VAAFFQLFDGLQAVATGALRGAGDTRTPMIWSSTLYWLVGLPVGAYLCFRVGWGAAGLWTGLCVALILIGCALLFFLAPQRKTICSQHDCKSAHGVTIWPRCRILASPQTMNRSSNHETDVLIVGAVRPGWCWPSG